MNAPRSYWLHSPTWDGFWLLSGLWLLPLVMTTTYVSVVGQWVLVGAVLLLWLPHRFATAYSAFCTPAYRPIIRAQWARFCILPAAIFAATFAFVFAPPYILPLKMLTRVQVLATIFFLYNSYHFAAQHFGVLSIYRIRAAQPQDPKKKHLEKAFCVIVGGVLVAVAQVFAGAEVVRDSLLYSWVPQDQLGEAFRIVRWIATPTIVLLTAGILAGEIRLSPCSVPKILYVTGIGIQGVLAFFLSPVAFLILWGVQHWLVSIALTAFMADGDRTALANQTAWYRFWGLFNHGFWPTVTVLVALTIMLTPLFEAAIHGAQGRTDAMQQLAATLGAYPWLIKLLVALNFATVYLHFVMDRAIFRFSNPEVRKVTGALLFAPRTSHVA